MSKAEDILLVITNVPNRPLAELMAESLVSQGVAACVNVLANCQSVYRWQGGVEKAEEVPLLIKTTAATYAKLEAAIRALHPYEVPEIIAVPLVAGLPSYIDWVAQETATPGA